MAKGSGLAVNERANEVQAEGWIVGNKIFAHYGKHSVSIMFCFAMMLLYLFSTIAMTAVSGALSGNWSHQSYVYRTPFATSAGIDNAVTFQFNTGAQDTYRSWVLWLSYPMIGLFMLLVGIGTMFLLEMVAYSRDTSKNATSKISKHGWIGGFVTMYSHHIMIYGTDIVQHMVGFPLALFNFWIMANFSLLQTLPDFIVLALAIVVTRSFARLMGNLNPLESYLESNKKLKLELEGEEGEVLVDKPVRRTAIQVLYSLYTTAPWALICAWLFVCEFIIISWYFWKVPGSTKSWVTYFMYFWVFGSYLIIFINDVVHYLPNSRIKYYASAGLRYALFVPFGYGINAMRGMFGMKPVNFYNREDGYLLSDPFVKTGIEYFIYITWTVIFESIFYVYTRAPAIYPPIVP